MAEEELHVVEEEDDGSTELWMVPFSDLMTLLVIFFLALYAYSVNKPDPCTELIAAVQGQVQGAQPLTGGTTVQIALPSGVLFTPGSAELRDEGVAPLVKVADAVKGRPFAIKVEGHTDNVPPGAKLRYRSNWELSAARAFAVIEYLSAQGIAKDRLQAVGCGEHRPVAPNETPEGRAANRRIAISLVCTPPIRAVAAPKKPET